MRSDDGSSMAKFQIGDEVEVETEKGLQRGLIEWPYTSPWKQQWYVVRFDDGAIGYTEDHLKGIE